MLLFVRYLLFAYLSFKFFRNVYPFSFVCNSKLTSIFIFCHQNNLPKPVKVCPFSWFWRIKKFLFVVPANLSSSSIYEIELFSLRLNKKSFFKVNSNFDNIVWFHNLSFVVIDGRLFKLKQNIL